ncbi:vacuolar protein sorting-associated protein 16, putative, partial [Plasmodium malariae]
MNTNEWNNIDNTYYGKQKLSNMLWSNEDVLKDSLTCSGYLGLIAVLRNKDKFDVYKKEDNLKIYTNIGRVISSCRLNSDGLICFGWNKNNDLVLLFKDNIVRVYSCFCEKIFVFSLDENIKNEGILYGSICEEGIIIITERLNIYVNYYFSGNNCFRYPAVDLKGKPNCVCTVEEDKLSDELNIEHNYFDTRVNNDLLRMNIKNYITNAFENKKENVNEMVNNKNVVLTEGKENYNIQMEDDRIKRRTNRELIKTSSYDVKRTEVDNTTSNSNRVSYRGKKEKELNIHLIIALCSGGFVLVNKHRFKYYDVYDNNNDNNNNNN